MTKTRQTPSKGSVLRDVFMGVIGPILVGVVVVIGQAFAQPISAMKVKKEETILEQRYMACNDAFNTLLRKLERASIVKGEVKYEPIPTTEKLTALEVNTMYCRLALFSSSSLVPKEFAELMNAEHMKIPDIGRFVQRLRGEMQIRGQGVLPEKFNFAYPTKQVGN